MNVLKNTQFAHVVPETQHLPPFLAKKLELAIAKACLKKQTDK